MPTNIISDLASAIGEVRNTLSSMTRAPDKIMNSARKFDDNSEARFFSRPIDSIARSAKKSILYFPVISSESMSPKTIGTITKAVQVRCAEYTRLMVSNMDPMEIQNGGGKNALIAAMRGATLKDKMLGENVNLIETRVYGEGLEPAMEDFGAYALLTESKRGKHQHRAQPDDYSIYDTVNRAADVNMEPSLKGLANPDNALHSNDPMEQEMFRDVNRSIMKNAAIGADRAHIENLRHENKMKELKYMNDARAQQEAERAKNNAANDALRSTNALAAEEAKQAKLAVKEREDRVARISRAVAFASRGTPNGNALATTAVADIMAGGEASEIAALRNDPNTARFVEMLEKVPAGAIRDGVLDISNTGNRASQSGTIDIDKVNQFSPVMLDLTITYRDASGLPIPTRDNVSLGIKGLAHIVPSMDMVTGFGSASQRDNLTLQFFRMTSGETSFVKDFVLNLDVAKMRGSGRTSSGAKMLETLRRQSEWNSRRSNWLIAAISKRNFIPPTSTIVMTSEEVDRIRTIYNVDYSKPAAVREILQRYNLMGFIIVNEPLGLALVYEDGDDDFDRIPLTTLEKKGSADSIKDIMTIMARS